MNNQEVFDRVYRHFVHDGQPVSLYQGGLCAYRGEEGARCAVGVLIPDELYSSDMEGRGVSRLIREFVEIDNLLDGADIELLTALQDVHDVLGRSSTPTGQKEQLSWYDEHANYQSIDVPLLSDDSVIRLATGFACVAARFQLQIPRA